MPSSIILLMQRRDFFTALAVAGVAAAQTPAPAKRRGRLKQCLTRGVFAAGPSPGQAPAANAKQAPAPANQMSFEEQCKIAADLGCHGFDLIRAADWPTMKKYGLRPTMAPPNMGVSINNGINDKSKHDALEKTMRASIDECAAGGCPNLITVSGQRQGRSDAEGKDNCVAFLNRVKAQAEDKNVTICIELLNDKIDHPDQQCNHTVWGVDVCKRVNSPRVKLLFDIYHMQIMEGDICRTIRDNFQWLAHFHTAGVPNRHEIDGTQELNYNFVARTLVDLGYTGYITHEYRPSPGRDPMESLKQALDIMDV